MNILYIAQYFNLPTEAGGTRAYWIAKRMVDRGHNVVMITTDGDDRHKEKVEIHDGIEIHYIVNPYNNKMSKGRKVLAFVRFIRLAIFEAKKINGIDMVYATSTPLTVGYIALRLKAIKKWPFVFEVRDLWPEFPIQIGAIKNKLIIWFLRRLEKKIYKESEYIVALSPGMQEGVISAGAPKEKTAMIPNMSKPDKFYPHTPNKEIAEKFGIDLTHFNLIHFGAMGVANGLMYIIEAANVCKKNGIDDIDFVFMGYGAAEKMLRNKVEELGLHNVIFIKKQVMQVVAEVVNLCDASITSFLNLPILKTNSPNKLFDSLSAGKPIIVNSSGWTKELVETNECGFYVDPERPEDLVAKLVQLKDDNSLCAKYGANSRRLSLEVYDKDKLTNKVVDVVERSFNNLCK